MLRAWIAAGFMMIAAIPVSADVYKYVDENGVVCYTDAPNGKKPLEVSSGRPTSATESETQTYHDKDYSGYVRKAALKYEIDPDLIKAVIKTESNGNHRAVSRKGAMGLMQLMPTTALDMNVSNPFNPEQNIEGGTKYLKYLLEKFNGNLTLALAAYNSGPGMVEKYGAVPPILETRQYVKRIFSLYNGKQYGDADGSGVSRQAVPKPTPIYKVKLEDGTILFTNATLEKNGKTRM
jgi:soluble lytic murein transglycosylase-like protein